jgi:hypothetical protein
MLKKYSPLALLVLTALLIALPSDIIAQTKTVTTTTVSTVVNKKKKTLSDKFKIVGAIANLLASLGEIHDAPNSIQQLKSAATAANATATVLSTTESTTTTTTTTTSTTTESKPTTPPGGG